MRNRSRNPFTTVTTAGLLLPVDLLTRIVEGDPDLPGLTPKDYHLHGGERLNEAASRAWNQCQAAWKAFRKRFADLPASDTGTTVTRDEWLLPLLQELGYGRLQTKPAIKFEEKEYPVSHGQGYLFDPPFKLGNAAGEFARLTAASDDSVQSLTAKEQRYARLIQSADYCNARLWANTWCAAFVWKKDETDLGQHCPTERKFRDIERNPHNLLPPVRTEIERLRD